MVLASYRYGSIAHQRSLYSHFAHLSNSLGSEAKELPENPLTRREQEILAMIVAGRSNQKIADLLYIDPGTVRVHYTEKSGLFSKIHSLLNSLSPSFNKLELSPYFAESLLILWS
ncbi:response regulator transcription factor [Laspinema palackyanum]|uniref:response regulator transcription factor n=1 Tax=Laspinema palackyanum TaxID=3231601 RepID=UPI00345D56B4